MYIGALCEGAIDRAARMAVRFLASAGGGEFVRTHRKVRGALVRNGREDLPFVASGVIYVREDSERARGEEVPRVRDAVKA
jgi:hypothetical protein